MKATKPVPTSSRFAGARGESLWRSLWIYGLLITGSLVFMWPFVWMATASIKLDRELFSEDGGLLPLQPIPRLHSPYIETRTLADYEHPDLARVQPLLEADLLARDLSWPEGIAPREAVSRLAVALFRRTAQLAPAAWWQLPPADLEKNLLGLVTPSMLKSERAALLRGLVIGRIAARSYDLKEELLVAPADIEKTWKITGPAHARFTPAPAGHAEGRALAYDFTSGDRFTLAANLTTTLDLDRLHRLQFFLQPDDSWHALDLVVEMKGKRFRAERSATLFDSTWMTVTWQEPGPDDLTNQQKNWILLRETGADPSYENRPGHLRLSLEVRQRGTLAAWWAKITRNYFTVMEHIPFGRYVATSLYLVILQIVCTIFSCSLVAYSFSRLRWPGRGACLLIMLGTMMLPGQVTMIPQFLVIRDLGWYNTLLPLWAPSLTANAFNVFLLYQFMRGIPRDLEDAARIDGCGVLRIYWHVMMPMIRPSLTVIGIFTFMGVWNDFMGPLIYLQDQRLYPLSLGLYALNVQSTANGGNSMAMMMAGSLLMTLPVIAIFFLGQRYFIRGITLTGMKG